jgi:hypothetical protein
MLSGAFVFGFHFIAGWRQMLAPLPLLTGCSSTQTPVRPELVVVVLPVAQAIVQIRPVRLAVE